MSRLGSGLNVLIGGLWLLHPTGSPESPPSPYYPGPGEEWARRPPAEVGMEAERVAEAVSFALSNPSSFGPDLRAALEARLTEEPYGEILGPMKPRGAPNGMILRGGYIIAEWGDTRRVDMTFSVSKSFLSMLAGLAWDRGLIALDRPLARSLDGTSAAELFASPHNRPITWRHLLTQTSEWEGTLWGKPDVADRRRGRDRSLRAPGTFWEYNDVRVNLTALALLHVWGRPLPEVLAEHLMRPMDASESWEWHGYRNSWILVNGRRVQSVSGGGHWGGGVWISTRDQARFGYLLLREGRWRERQLLSPEWVARATRPSGLKPEYGYMMWLNTEERLWPGVSERSFAALGGGTNAIWISPEEELVVVVRWIERSQLGELLRRVESAVVAPLPSGSGPDPEGTR